MSEIALARKAGRPVVGLHSWTLSEVAEAAEAVRRALAAVAERG